jgi:hypothetical protein
MRKIVIPLIFVFMLAAALAVNTVVPVSAEESAKPQHDGECPFKL